MQANGVVEELCGIWILKYSISPKTVLMNRLKINIKRFICMIKIFCTITQSIIGVI